MRKQILSLTSLYIVALQNDSPQELAAGAMSTSDKLQQLLEGILPSLAAVILPDMIASPPELIEIQVVELIDILFNNIGVRPFA